MRAIDLIQKKKEGFELSEDEIRFLISGYTDGTIPDYQMSAFAMAVCFRGMTDRETVILTDAMAHSGETEDLSQFGEKTVDKHSSGGVGDKTTMIVAPLVASLGGKVAKITGRGLGHTGGTADKLESIPGYCVTMGSEQFKEQLSKLGIAVIAQSKNMTPADKKLYALRDVTATVDSIPLIASSIMSKKLAAGAASIVLDVKVGSGAFMQTLKDARRLAKEMVDIGSACGKKMAAVLTDMNVPLGTCIGNSLEVKEAVEFLKGKDVPDLCEVCLALSSNMLSLTNGWEVDYAREMAMESLHSGKAYETMKKWIAAQGGDISVLEDLSLLPQAEYSRTVLAPASGYLYSMDAKGIGETSVLLGAGRATKQDAVDPAAGIVLLKKPGDRVSEGEKIAVLYSNRGESFEEAEAHYLASCKLSFDKPSPRRLVYDVIRS